jgi:hypothetical protein
MQEQYEQMACSDAVITFDEDNRDAAELNAHTYKIEHFFEHAPDILGVDGWHIQKWLTDGVDCELLKLAASKWRQGKIRFKLSLEFCPDQPDSPESPLDELRMTLSADNQP